MPEALHLVQCHTSSESVPQPVEASQAKPDHEKEASDNAQDTNQEQGSLRQQFSQAQESETRASQNLGNLPVVYAEPYVQEMETGSENKKQADDGITW